MHPGPGTRLQAKDAARLPVEVRRYNDKNTPRERMVQRQTKDQYWIIIQYLVGGFIFFYFP